MADTADGLRPGEVLTAEPPDSGSGQRERSSRLIRLAGRALVPAIAVGLGLLVGAIAILAAGGSPIEAYVQLVSGAVGSQAALSATLARSVPIVVVGVGLAIAFRAGCFNLGAEGQMILGALVVALLASGLGDLPGPVLVLVAAAAGCVAGALWAIGPAWLQTRFEVPLLITTLLLNYIAAYFAAYLVSYPFRDVTASGALAQTVMIPEAAQLPFLVPGGRLHAGVLLLLILPFVAWWLQRRTVIGYEMRMTGHNPSFSEYGGVDRKRITHRTMLLSGAICGLAGAMIVLGIHYRYIDASITTPGYAWTGFTATLLAVADPVWTLVAGVFLGGLEVGAAAMERRVQIPIQVVDIVQASIILMVAIRVTLGRWLSSRLGSTR
jgi:simple sugar transport system permease protein